MSAQAWPCCHLCGRHQPGRLQAVDSGRLLCRSCALLHRLDRIPLGSTTLEIIEEARREAERMSPAPPSWMNLDDIDVIDTDSEPVEDQLQRAAESSDDISFRRLLNDLVAQQPPPRPLLADPAFRVRAAKDDRYSVPQRFEVDIHGTNGQNFAFGLCEICGAGACYLSGFPGNRLVCERCLVGEPKPTALPRVSRQAVPSGWNDPKREQLMMCSTCRRLFYPSVIAAVRDERTGILYCSVACLLEVSPKLKPPRRSLSEAVRVWFKALLRLRWPFRL